MVTMVTKVTMMTMLTQVAVMVTMSLAAGHWTWLVPSLWQLWAEGLVIISLQGHQQDTDDDHGVSLNLRW